MFRSLIPVLAFAVLGALLPESARATLEDPSLPPDVVRMSAKFAELSSTDERIKLFKELRQLVHVKAQAVPPELKEVDLPKAQSLFELDLLLEEVDLEKLGSDQCGRYPSVLRSLADPQALSDDQLGASAYFAIQVVKSVCRIK